MAQNLTHDEARNYPLSTGETADLIALVSNRKPQSWVQATEVQPVGTVVYAYAMGDFRRGVVVKNTKTKTFVALTTAAGSAPGGSVRVQTVTELHTTVYVASAPVVEPVQFTEAEETERAEAGETPIEADQRHQDEQAEAPAAIVARRTPRRELLAQMAGRLLREEPLTFDLPNVLTLHSQAGKVSPISTEDDEQTGPAAMTNTTTFFHQPTEVTEAKTAPVRQAYGSGVIRALENAWHFLMSTHGELPDVMMITGVGMEGFGGKWGHFRPTGWNGKAGDKRVKLGEIFLAGETLSKGGQKVMNTLTHEATHVLAHVRGVKDTSRQHRYHNGEFRKLAGELGMEYAKPSPDKTIGFSAVTLTDETVQAYAAIIEELDRAIKADVTLPVWLGGTETGSDDDDNGDQDGGENVHGKRPPRDPDAPRTGNQKATCLCDEPTIIYISKKNEAKGTIRCDDCDASFRFR